MESSQAWVELALETLSCSQKTLAQRVGVSQPQISKWKSGEYMSSEMEDQFRAITNIGDQSPEFVRWAGSLGDAVKWKKLIALLAEEAQENAETGYKVYPLREDLGLLCVQVSDTLLDMGVNAPEAFPPELEPCLNGDGDNTEDDAYDNSDELWELLETNPYSKVIRNIFNSLTDVWAFYAAYIQEVVDDEDELLFDIKGNIEACLIDLAACKIQIDETIAPDLKTFRYRVTKDYEKWLTALKTAAFRAGTPLRAELLDMVGGDHEELGHAAEAESLGFNASRLHPDIYMNELLIGMRVIHQVLPAILKKLDITVEDFALDESNLHIKM